MPGTAASATVTRAAARQPVDLTGLGPIADHLAEVVGVPLKALALNSGHFCVLTVDAKALSERLRRRLADRPNVERVEVLPDTAAIGVRVVFAAGADEARMTGDRLAAAVALELELPFNGEALGNGRFALRVNLETLTLSLVDRLKAVPEIESVQPNYILRLRGPLP